MADPVFSWEVAFNAYPGLTYRQAVLDDTPNGYWRLDDLTTQTGTAGSLTEAGGSVPSASSLLTTDTASVARTLDGAALYYTAADGVGTDLADVFTLEAWITPDSVASRTIMSKGTNAYHLRITSGGLVQLVQQAGSSIAASTVALVAGTTYHVAVTKNGATVKIYINGVDRTGAVTNFTLVDTATALNIGRLSTGGEFFDGKLDEVAIYPTALSATRVQVHYEAGNPTWTNLSNRVMGCTSKRGRQRELDRIDAGTMRVRFNNSDRALDPTHTGSVFYPNVVPMRPIRWRATHAGTTYHLFKGFVASWPQSWDGPNYGEVEVDCIDAFLPLSKADIGNGELWPREFTGARISRTLDAVDWPTADRSIDTGYSEEEEVTFPVGAGITALGHCYEVAFDELGVFFCDGRGRAVFHDRHHRRTSTYLTTAGTFADANTVGIPYVDVQLDTNPDQLWNDVQISGGSGVTARAQDLTSQGRYTISTLGRQVHLARPEEAQEQADYLITVGKDPRNRLSGLAIRPTSDPVWAQALGREIGDHITIKRWPQQVGSAITQECSVESVELRAEPGFFEARFLVSTPAYSAVDWWILEDATYGVLDSTTKLVY